MTEPEHKPKRKRKEKPKRELNPKLIFPLALGVVVSSAMIIGVIIAVLMVLGIVFVGVRQDVVSNCPSSVACDFSTPTALPALYPTVPPLPQPTLRDMTVSSLALFPDQNALLVGAYLSIEQSSAQVRHYPIANSDMRVYELVDTVPTIPLGQYGLTSIQDIVQQPGGDIYAFASRVDQQVQLYFGDLGVLFTRFGDADYSPISYPGYGDIAFSPDGRFFALAGDSGLQIRSTDTLDLIAAEPSLADETFDVQAVAYSASGEVAVAYRRYSNGGTFHLKVWETHDGQLDAVHHYVLPQMAFDMIYLPTTGTLIITMPTALGMFQPTDTLIMPTILSPFPNLASVAYRSNSNELIVAGNFDGLSGALMRVSLDADGALMWDENGIVSEEIQRFDTMLTEVILTEDGSTAYIGTNSGIVEIVAIPEPN